MANLANTLTNVFYLNTIAAYPTYGSTLLDKRLKLVDASNNSAFNNVPGNSAFYPTIQSAGVNGNCYQFSVAETLAICTPTEPNSTLAQNTVYSFFLWQWNPYTITAIQGTISYNTGASGAITTGSATSVWVLEIPKKGFQVTLSAGGSQSLTITAAVGYPILFMSQLQGITAGSATTGVASIGYTYGTNNTLGDMWYPKPDIGTLASYSGYVATNTYDICTLSFQDENQQKYKTYICINTGDPNYGSSSSKFLQQFLNNDLTLGGASPSTYYLQQANAPQNTNA